MKVRHTKASKVAVSLPADLLRRVEALRGRTGESRSAVVRRALELLFRRLDHYGAVRDYVEGYQLLPESEAEQGLARPSVEEFAADEWQVSEAASDEDPGDGDAAR